MNKSTLISLMLISFTGLISIANAAPSNQIQVTYDKIKGLNISYEKPGAPGFNREQIDELQREYFNQYKAADTPEKKARVVVSFLRKVARSTHFWADSLTKKYPNTRMSLFMYLPVDDGNTHTIFPLIFKKDLKKVEPIVFQLLSKKDNLTLIRHPQLENIFDNTMPVFFMWPKDEDWYGPWRKDTMADLRSLCETNGELFCDDFDIMESDTDGDGQYDQVCGYYENYFGATDWEFRCVHR